MKERTDWIAIPVEGDFRLWVRPTGFDWVTLRVQLKEKPPHRARYGWRLGWNGERLAKGHDWTSLNEGHPDIIEAIITAASRDYQKPRIQTMWAELSSAQS